MIDDQRNLSVAQLIAECGHHAVEGARLFLATLPPPRPGGLRAVPIDLILSLNSRIRLTSAGEGAALVDVYPELQTDVTRFVGVDGSHLTEAGYQRLALLFFNAIRGDLEAR